MIEIPPLAELHFQYSWIFWLMPLPIVLYYLWPSRRAKLSHPNIAQLSELPLSLRQIFRKVCLDLLFIMTIVALFFSAAKPQRITVLSEAREGRNIMLVLDLSRSMAATDFGSGFVPLSRIEGLKQAVLELIELRKGDKLGIVLFGSEAFLQAPLTYDHTLVAQLIQRLRLGMVGDATAMGDGMALALKRIEDIEGDSKTLILFTDGVSNAGEIDPMQAARIASTLSVRIHTIGIGSSQRPGLTLPGGLTLPSMGRGMEFDEASLREIARLTGGQYFHASDVESLAQISREIDKLERTSEDPFTRDQVEDFSGVFSLLALWSLLLYFFSQHIVFKMVN